ncbi:MAG: DUF4124 domain-containing protein [Exilibacterium sp.]
MSRNSLFLTHSPALFQIGVFCLASCFSVNGAADIYKTVDENGKVIYSDNPRGKKIEAVDLPTVNRQPAQPVIQQRKNIANATTVGPKSYDIDIETPTDQTHVPPGQRDLIVNTSITPPLFKNHKIQVLLDGQLQQSGRSNNVVIKEIFRGAHQIEARVIDQKGNTLGRSEAVTVYVIRPTVSN